MSRFTQQKQLTNLKKEKEFSWLKEVNSQSLQVPLLNLDNAFKNFFKGTTKYPKFKSKKDKNSFSVPQYIKLLNNKLYIPKFKQGIKLIEDRLIPTNSLIKQATITKTPTNKYFVSILVQQEYQPKPKTNQEVGIDLGLKDYLITSNGLKQQNHKYLKKYEKKLRTHQKHLSRKQRGSNRFEKQRFKVAKIHEKVVNSRKDYLHKLSTQLVSDYDFIALETLKVKNMVKNRKLAKSINDASWGTFVGFLEYKARWNDKEVVKIDSFFPSTKTCSCCGYKNNELTLKDREWGCVSCGVLHDRDINAATNILSEAKRI